MALLGNRDDVARGSDVALTLIKHGASLGRGDGRRRRPHTQRRTVMRALCSGSAGYYYLVRGRYTAGADGIFTAAAHLAQRTGRRHASSLYTELSVVSHRAAGRQGQVLSSAVKPCACVAGAIRHGTLTPFLNAVAQNRHRHQLSANNRPAYTRCAHAAFSD